MKSTECSKILRFLTLAILSLILTSVFSVFASIAEGASALSHGIRTHMRNDGRDVNYEIKSGEFMKGAVSNPDSVDTFHSNYVEGEVLVVVDAPSVSAFSVTGVFNAVAYSQAISNQAEVFAGNFGLEALNTFSDIASISGKSIIHLRSEHKSIEELIQELSSAPDVENVSPNYIRRLSRIPNDEYYPMLWGMENIGMPRVWDYVTGSNEIYVAIIDSGIDYNHEDLRANMGRDSYGN